VIREFRKAHFAFAMARWATGSIATGLMEAYRALRRLRHQMEEAFISTSPGCVLCIAADTVIAFTAIYILGHVIAAWLRGSFGVSR
jgi:hypothetical protein